MRFSGIKQLSNYIRGFESLGYRPLFYSQYMGTSLEGILKLNFSERHIVVGNCAFELLEFDREWIEIGVYYKAEYMFSINMEYIGFGKE